ncbi:hypothetical protein ACFQ4C_02280 [Larkinella insperata]|uniref:Alpha/beta hydrolase n=1 Tax=Larkinella insperata TaxID=332158 RepID=A0ABW3Q1M1_9BACT|nr:hypothetical protein [Larkinella insperata]
MKLVFIHGRDQQGKDRVELQSQWKASLLRGLNKAGLSLPEDIDIIFPFYGDKLADLINQFDTPLVADVLTKGDTSDSSEAEFRGKILYEMAVNQGISDAEIQTHYAGLPQEKGPLNWEWVQAILRALDRTPLGDRTIDRFTRDVYVYLTNKAVRRAIDAIVAKAFVADEPYVVIGHSLGSIVGYNVLSSLSSTRKILLYLTVGSPLAIKAIKRQLDSPLATPLSVKSWYNALDDRDVVALYPLDESNFPVTPTIINNTRVNNHTDNRHGIAGYLDDPDVALTIYKAIQSA